MLCRLACELQEVTEARDGEEEEWDFVVKIDREVADIIREAERAEVRRCVYACRCVWMFV
jgi:hypothetical protein